MDGKDKNSPRFLADLAKSINPGSLLLKIVLLTILIWSGSGSLFANEGVGHNQDEKAGRLYLSGHMQDSHHEPVADAEIKVFINGELFPVGENGDGHGGLRTEPNGSFVASLPMPASFPHFDRIDLAVSKTGFADKRLSLSMNQAASHGSDRYLEVEAQLERRLGPAFWIATTIFILAYILISFELLHRTLAAMLGASIMLVVSYTVGTLNPEYHILSYERAVHAIDMNVIFLLMGMMIIVGILKHTGVFQWCAYKCYQLARGNVMVLSVILMTFAAVSSAFLDNVTTMLLLTPVTIEIALSLQVSPLSLLLPLILASNIGGTATLIGDPPNIMIGSYAGITFMDFVKNLTITCVVSILALFIYAKMVYGRVYQGAKVEDVEGFISKLREEYKITDSMLLTVGMIVMAITVGFFFTHSIWHMEVSIAALFGAAVLFTYGLVTKRIDLLELIEKDIEWPTLLFFMFLFMLVGAVEEAGLLAIIADWVLRMSAGSLVAAICLILWVSAIMSAFVDNIPFTATMLPIVAYLTKVIPGAESGVLWWALAFGACFGGNGTMIGASANVVTMGIAEAAGYPMRFMDFLKTAFPYMLVSVGLANVWLLLFY